MEHSSLARVSASSTKMKQQSKYGRSANLRSSAETQRESPRGRRWLRKTRSRIKAEAEVLIKSLPRMKTPRRSRKLQGRGQPPKNNRGRHMRTTFRTSQAASMRSHLHLAPKRTSMSTTITSGRRRSKFSDMSLHSQTT